MKRKSVIITGLLSVAVAVPTVLAVHALAADSLLSLNKPVTVSSTESPSFGGALAVDGNLSTRWASIEGHDPEWITVDLGSAVTISRVVLKWEAAYGKAYRIELSYDNQTWTQAYSTTTGDGATDDLTIAGTGRYVRMYGTQRGTAWGYSLFEFEVYGTAQTPPPPPPSGGLLSQNKPVTVSSIESSAFGGALAVDGSTSTRWASIEGHDPEWITVDLGSAATISRVVLKWETAYGKAYRIELSNDNQTWSTAYTTTTGDGATDDLTIAGTGRYVRLYGTQRGTAWGYSLFELEVYGTTGQTTPPTTPPAPPPTTPPAPPPGWTLAWQDEFNDPQGTRPNSSKWVYDTGGEPTWGNQEWQYYTNRTENVSTDGQGNLAISARREQLPGMTPCLYGTCDITSGRITTKGKFNQAYGRFEARIRIPGGQGLWPAFWMMGNNIDSVGWPTNGEVDIMEIIGSEPSTLYGTLHGPGYSDAAGPGGSVNLPGGAQFKDAFHVFAVEWSPDTIIWKLDDQQYFSFTKSQLPAGKVWVFDHPFYMLLNLAVGGTWPGPPNASTQFPATLLVDYVRVYTKA